MRVRLLLRAGNRCERCGGRLDTWSGMSVHHRRPRGMGGTRRPDTMANLLVLCGSGTTGCHGEVEANRFWARGAGLLVSQQRDPADVPVEAADGRLFVLGVDGGKTYLPAA